MLPFNIPFEVIDVDNRGIIQASGQKFKTPVNIRKTLDKEVVKDSDILDLVKFEYDLKGRSGNVHTMVYEFKRDKSLEEDLGEPLFVQSFYKKGVSEEDQYRVLNDLIVSEVLVSASFYIGYHSREILEKTTFKKSVYYLNIWKEKDEQNLVGCLTRRGKVWSRMMSDLIKYGENEHKVTSLFENKLDYFLLTIKKDN